MQFATVFKAEDLANRGRIVAVKKVATLQYSFEFRNNCFYRRSNWATESKQETVHRHLYEGDM